MVTRSESHRKRPARGRRTPPSGRQAVRGAVVLLAGAATVLLAVPGMAATGFAPAGGSPYPTGSGPNSVATGDLNGDGKVDLVTADVDNNTVTVMLGDGAADPAFPATAAFPVGEYPYAVVIEDFNGDGQPDLATVNYYETVSVLLGDGQGGFAEAPGSPINIGGQHSTLATGDLNRDGKVDLAVVDSSSSDIRVLLGNGTGGFTAAPGSPFQAGAGGSGSVVIVDLNGDGKLDLVGTYPAPNEVWILLGDGAGGLAAADSSPVRVAASRPSAVAVADVNADTKPDLVTANALSDNITVFLGDGAAEPSFAATAASPISTGGYVPTAVAIDDIDRDGKADVVVANQDSNNVSVLIGDGAGGFAPVAGSPFDSGGITSYSLAIADMNGDTRIDLVTGNYSSNNVTVLLNDLVTEPPATTATEPPATTTTEPPTTTTTEPPSPAQPGATTTTTQPPTATGQPAGTTTTTMPPTTTTATTTDPLAGRAGDSGTEAQPAGPATGPATSDRDAAAVAGATATPPGQGAGLARSGTETRRLAALGTALLCLGALLRMRRRPI